MEFHPESGDQKIAKTLESCSSSQEKERKKLGSILKFEKCERSYNEIHPQVLKNGGNLSPKHRSSTQKQQFETKIHKREELVLCMSNLPSYLEKGGKPQDKAFNIGVLDWRLLQKWQHSQMDVTNSSGTHLPSTSKISSSEGSSSHQQQRIVKKPSVPFHSTGPPTKACYSGKKPIEPIKTAMAGPTVGPIYRCSEQVCASDSSKVCDCRSVEEKQCKISGEYNGNNYRMQFVSDYDPLNEFGPKRESQSEKTSFKDVNSTKVCPYEMKVKMPFPRSASNSPSRKKNMENRESSPVQSNSAENVVSGVKIGISESRTMRSPSPTRRFNFGLSRNSKISSSNTYSGPEKSSDGKIKGTSVCPCDTTAEKSRSKSSPLRRLLDPLLKSKGNHERNVSTADRTLKSSTGERETPVSRSLKAKLDLKGCRKDDFVVPHPMEKNGSVRMQALLQVAVKNGLPLFTFTVDNCSDILAATVKEFCSKKILHRWVYTFFSFSEMKKKNMYWINKGNKDGFVPNVIAQMKVSDVPCANLERQRGSAESSLREFVLSSMSSKDADQTSCSLQNEELAAIIVKFPEKIINAFQEVDKFLNSRDDKGIRYAKDGVFSTTVILPGGHHGVPSKGLGEPSPLIERWKTGGSCDCGGWDLGCRLSVLASRDHSYQKPNSTKSQSTAFKLFSQEEAEENKPIFILSPFEDGIFSVEFNSSLTLIQAFSIGIAVLSSRKTVSLPLNMFGGKLSEGITPSENSTPVKFSDRNSLDLSAKYVSYPPLSPVGRV